MIKGVKTRSYLLTLFSKESQPYTSNIFKISFLVTQFLFSTIANSFPKSFLRNAFSSLPLRSIFLFLFLISPIIGVGDGLQLSTSPSSSLTPTKISSRIFNLSPFSLTAISLMSLTIFLLKERTKIIQKLNILRFEVLLLIFFIVCTISTVSSFNTQASFVWLLKLSALLLAYIVFSRMNLSIKDISFISLIFLATLIFEEFFAIAQFLKGGLLGFWIEKNPLVNLESFKYSVNGTSYFRVIGTLYHPKALSFYIVMLLPQTLGLMYIKKKTVKILALLGIFFGLLTISLTLSRWEFIFSFSAIFLTMFLFKKYLRLPMKNFSVLVKMALLSLILVSSFIFINPFTMERFLNLRTAESNFKIRMELIDQSLYMIQHHPLGTGGGAFTLYFANYDMTKTNLSRNILLPVHSLYLLLLTETGVFGLLFFVLMICDFIHYFIIKINRLTFSKKIFAIAFFSSIIVFLLHGTYEVKQLSSALGMLFWIQLGLCTNLLRSHSFRHST